MGSDNLDLIDDAQERPAVSEEILTGWESFASSVLPGNQFDKAMLRDNAAEMLTTIAKDMETPQTAAQQTVKSIGRGPGTAQDTSAERIVTFD